MKVVGKYSNYLIYRLLESVMITSREFADIIYNMPVNDKISDVIFEIISDKKDIKTNYNLVDINKEKNDEISFLPDTQYQRFLTKGDDVTTKTKSNAKIGRMVSQILKDNGHNEFTQSDIEKFVNSFKASWNKKMGIVNRKTEVVKGKDILKWYNSNTYNSDKGTLGSSCMRYEETNHYMNIYAENPEKISMVIITEEDKLVARALFWILDDDVTFAKFYLDRIYVEEDSDFQFLYDWVLENLCNKNKYLLESYRNANGYEMKVSLNKTTFEHYPYADTFNYLCQKLDGGKLTGNGYVSNTLPSRIDSEYMISEIRNHYTGSPSALSHVFSKKLDIYIIRNEAIHDPEIGWITKSLCKKCEWSGEWTYEDNAVWSEKMQDWIPKNSAVNDPKFGIVHRDAIIKIATKYIGDYDNQIDLYEALEMGKKVFETETVLENDKDIEWHIPEYIGLGSRFYKSDLLGIDCWDQWQIKLASYQIFDCGEYNSVVDQTPDLSRFLAIARANRYKCWMTKDDAALFGVEPNLQKSKWMSVVDYIKPYDTLDYIQFMKFLDESDIDSKTKERISKSKTALHKYWLVNSSSYKKRFKIKTEMSNIDAKEVYLDLFDGIWKDFMINQDDIEKAIVERFEDYNVTVDESLIQFAFEIMSALALAYVYYDDTNTCRSKVNEWLGKTDQRFKNSEIDISGFTEVCRIIFRGFINDVRDSKVKHIEEISRRLDINSETLRDFFTYSLILTNFNSINPFV